MSPYRGGRNYLESSILISWGIFYSVAVLDCTGHGQVEAYSTWTLKDKHLAKLVVDEWG